LMASLINGYGFGRCLTPEHQVNETNLADLVPPDKLVEIYASDQLDTDLLAQTLGSLVSGAFTADHRSQMLEEFRLYDSDYYIAIAMLTFHLVFYRYCNYLTIQNKIKAKS